MVLNVAISRFGSCRLNAERDKLVLGRGLFHRHADHVKEFGLLQDEVVGRTDHDDGVLVPLGNAIAGVGYAGGGVLAHRLCQDMIRVELWKLVLHMCDVFLVCDHVYITRVANRKESLERRLKERLSGTEDIKKLFGFGVAAVRPEAAPHASRHEDYIKMFVHYWISTNRSKTMKIVTNSGQ